MSRFDYVRAGLIGAAIILLVSGSLSAQSGGSPKSFDTSTFVNANNILMFCSNNAMYGRDQSNHFGHEYGTFYPYTSIANIQNGSAIKSPLYSAGIWMGGTVSGGTRVSLAEFSSEFWPGPMSGGTFVANADTAKIFRVYKIYSDSAAGNPNTDYLEWPVSQGAPTDASGHPLLLGQQTLFSVYCDANPARHTLIDGSTTPLGIEVRQTTWASNTSGLERIIYLEYQLYNKGGNNISDFYVSIWLDPDLGGVEDDLAGSDTSEGIFYCYNANNADAVYGASPPAIGVKMIAGPAVASASDTALFFRTLKPGYRNLEMSSFVNYINGDDAQSSTESYNLMKGLRRNGSAQLNGTRFSFPGDPVASTGDRDTLPANIHFLGSFGPISFAAGDSQYVLVKLGIGQGADRLSSITNLKQILTAADDIPLDAEDGERTAIPNRTSIEQNYPNPFNPSTTIRYVVHKSSLVNLEIINLLGQKVKTLVAETKRTGEYQTTWDGTDDYGRSVSSGVYFYRFRTGDETITRKMLLLK